MIDTIEKQYTDLLADIHGETPLDDLSVITAFEKRSRHLLEKTEYYDMTAFMIDNLTSMFTCNNTKHGVISAMTKVSSEKVLTLRKDIQAMLIPLNIAKGDALLQKGLIDDCLKAWEEVLKIDPGNHIVRNKLNRLLPDDSVTDKEG